MPTNHQAQVKMTPETQASRVPREFAAVSQTIRNEPVVRQTAPVAVTGTASAVHHSLSESHGAHEQVQSGDCRAVGRGYLITKRAFDLILGSLLLVFAIPIVLIAAIAIRIDTPGSPFFFQKRVGKDGKLFTIFKLRGMWVDARARFPDYYDYSRKRDLEFCFHHEMDPRVTRAGKFIRRTSIDELPNLWNVVMGEVSLVGPRPEIPEVMALYGNYRDEYLSVKPGITCLSKCSGRDKLTKRETIELDLSYIRRRSLLLDLRILWSTLRGVILRRDVW